MMRAISFAIALSISAFKTLLVRTYASALASYQGQKFEFRPLRAKPGEREVTVNVRVLQPGGQPVAIDYDMERTAEGWKVYNMSVAGISLVLNYRTAFSNAVREAGIDGRTQLLRAPPRRASRGARTSTGSCWLRSTRARALQELATAHERTMGAVRARLLKYGRINA